MVVSAQNLGGLDCFIRTSRETYLYLQFLFRSGHDKLQFSTDPCNFERFTVERLSFFTPELSNLRSPPAKLGVLPKGNYY